MERLALVAIATVLLLAACSQQVAPRAAPVPTDATTQRLAYGDQRDQWVDLTVPAGEGPFPVIVLLHGGYWYEQYQADLMEALASDAVRRGWAAANVEYRRVNGAGGWPMTFEDVAAGLDVLATAARLDLTRVTIVGHSAGGQLALWAAGRDQLPGGAPGADPKVMPCGVVGQAPVADLVEAARLGLGGGAAPALMGGSPSEVPERYAMGNPTELLPLGVPVLIVQGTSDNIVPASLTVAFADAAAAAGDEVEYLQVDGDHFVVLDPEAVPWEQTMQWVSAHC